MRTSGLIMTILGCNVIGFLIGWLLVEAMK